MALVNTTLNSLGTHLSGLATHLSVHTANPSTTGVNESTAARLPVTWTVASNGQLTTSSKAFTGGAASGPCTYMGMWSASSGGTFRGSFIITGDSTFNASGEFTITSVTINATST